MGSRGGELIASALRVAFDPLVEAVYAAGGEIMGFAGDAFTAMFPEDGRRATLRRVKTAALRMQEALSGAELPTLDHGERVRLQLKISVASGTVGVECVLLPTPDRGVERRRPVVSGPMARGALVPVLGRNPAAPLPGCPVTWYFWGQVLEEVASAQMAARAGDLVFGPSAEARLTILRPTSGARRTDGFRVLAAAVRHRLRVTRVPLPPALPVLSSPEGDTGNVLLPAAIREFPPEGELREVTALFLCFDGQPDPRSFVGLIATVIDRHGGGGLRFDFSDKGWVMWAFFGAPTAWEDATHRALLAASTLVAAGAPGAPRPRCGVARGVAFAGFLGNRRRAEFTCIGRVANLATRLMQAAPPGEVWCSAEVAASEVPWTFLERERQLLKGFPEALLVSALGERLVDLSSRGTGVVARPAEETALYEALAPALAMSPAGMVVVSGEPGVGKSRLVESVLHALRGPRPVTLLRGAADALHPEGLGPLTVALRGWASDCGLLDRKLAAIPKDHPALPHLRRARPVLGVILGETPYGAEYQYLEPPQRREARIHALTEWILALATLGSTILLMEDAHGLDEDSLRVLRELVRRDSAGLVVLVVGRPDETGASSSRQALLPLTPNAPLGGPWAGLRVTRVQVQGLSEEGLAALSQIRLGQPAAPALLALLQAETGGNPLLADRVLSWLREKKALLPTEEGLAPGTDLVVPADAASLLTAGFDRLPRPLRRLVRRASALGAEMDISLLRRIADDPAFESTVAEGVQRRLWGVFGTRLRFRQLLLRDTIYGMLARTKKEPLHRRIAETILQLHADEIEAWSLEVAEHYEAAEDAPNAARWLVRAAESARDVYRNHEALSLYDRALRWLPQSGGDPARTRAQLARVRLLTDLARWTEGLATAVAAQAEAAGQPEELTELQVLEGGLLLRIGRVEEARSCLTRIDPNGRSFGVAGQLEIALGRLGQASGDPAALRRHGEAAERIFDAAADPRGASQAANLVGLGLFHLEGPAAATPHFERALTRLREGCRRGGEAHLLNNLGVLKLRLGDATAAAPLFSAALELARRTGERQLEARVLGNLGSLAGAEARYDDALAAYEAAIKLWAEIGEPAPHFHVSRADIKLRLGHADAEAALEAAQKNTAGQRSPEHLPRLLLVEGHFLRARGDEIGARERYLQGLELAREHAAAIAEELRAALDALEKGLPTPRLL